MYRFGCVLILVLCLPVLSTTAQQQDIAEITAPQAVSELKGVVSIYGTASAGALQSYFLEAAVYQQEPPEWIPISLPVSKPVLNGVLAEWDTRTLPDGVYRLRLHVLRCAGESLYFEVEPLRLANGLVCPVNIPDLPLCRAVSQAAPTATSPATVQATPPATDAPPPEVAAVIVEAADLAPTCVVADFRASYTAQAEGTFLDLDLNPQLFNIEFATDFEKSGEQVTPNYNTSGGTPPIQQLIAADIPVWIPQTGVVFSLPENNLDEASLSAWTFEPATPESLARIFGEELPQDEKPEDVIIYIGERQLVQPLANGGSLSTLVNLVGIYDDDGQLAGSWLLGTYSDCSGCPVDVLGQGWTVFGERISSTQPPNTCLIAATPEPAADVPPILNCIVPNFYATYETVLYEGTELHLDPNGIFVEPPFFAPSFPINTFTIPSLNPDGSMSVTLSQNDGEESSLTWGVDGRWGIFTYPRIIYGWERSSSSETEEEGTLYYTHNAPDAEFTFSGVEVISVAGFTVEANVYVAEQVEHHTATSSLGKASSVDEINHRTRYYDTQTGVFLREDFVQERANCAGCVGGVNGSTLRTVYELIATNQPLGVCNPQ